MPLQIGLIGASGKMGKKISSCIGNDPSFSLAWEFNSSSLYEPLHAAHIIIDFSSASALEKNLRFAVSTNTPIVIGTTGFSEPEKQLLEEASKKIPIFWAPNFSLGMALLTHAIETLSPLFQPNFKAHIEETHHIHKKDSPSGSAIALEKAARQGYDKPLPIESHRIGETIGDHSIVFSSNEETITFEHKALSREIFALGALKAAKFLVGKEPKLYSMKDLLSLSFSH